MKLLTKLFLNVFYRVKHQSSLENLPKLIEVVMSCDTAEQCASAIHYCALYQHRYASSDDGFGETARKVVGSMVEFLNDTRDHCDNGWHKPAWNEFKPIHKYPHLNDYTGKLLGTRFKATWTRGVSSVAGQ